jgi:hypothetical protein
MRIIVVSRIVNINNFGQALKLGNFTRTHGVSLHRKQSLQIPVCEAKFSVNFITANKLINTVLFFSLDRYTVKPAQIKV